MSDQHVAIPDRHATVDGAAAAVLVVLCALWGLQQVSVKLAVMGGLPPIQQAALRSTVAVSLVVAWIAVRGGAPGLRGLFRADATLLPGAITALIFAVEFATLFPGLRLTSASHGVLFLYTAPFFTALGAHLFLRAERLSRRAVAGLVVAFAGVVVAFADGLRTGQGNAAGDLLCLCAALGWAANTVLVKANRALSRAPAGKILAWQLGGAVPFLLIASLIAGEPARWPTATVAAWLWLGYQSAIVAFASYLTWFWLILTYPAASVSGFTFLTPVFGIGFVALILGERVGWGLLAGVAAIAVGLRLLSRR